MVKKISKNKQAKTYALAWLEASKDNKVNKKIFEEVKTLQNSFNSDKNLWKIFSMPNINLNRQLEIISEICKKLKFSTITTNTLKIIATNNKLNILDLILDEFINMYYKDNNITEVDVCSAVELTSSQKNKLKKALEKRVNSEIILNYEIKPEILGGLKISYNSFLIDDTLQTKLSNIRNLILAK